MERAISQNRPIKIVMGLFFAPIIATLVFSCLVLAQGASDDLGLVATFLICFIYILPLAYLLTIVMGLPLYLLLHKLNWVNIFSIVALGIGLGVLSIWLGKFIPGAKISFNWGLFAGISGALGFWGISK